MPFPSSPWLSVVIPVFRGATTLERTLASLRVQGEGIKIIAVVQDGKDGSSRILAEMTEYLPLQIIDAPNSTSWMQNTNIGLSQASTPYATMLHQDDLWRPNRLNTLRAAIQAHPDARLWLHAADFIDENDNTVGRFAPPFGAQAKLLAPETTLRSLLVQNTVPLPAAMFRLEDVLVSGGLDETLWYTADWDLWLRLACLGPVSWHPDAQSAFRIHENSLTVTGSRNLSEFRCQLDKPVQRYIDVLPENVRSKTLQRSNASNALNAALAAAFHGNWRPIIYALRDIACLGPTQWGRFFSETQIVRRLWPRIRMRLGIRR